jgi:3-oxoacid CoA-transferase subunit B
VVMQHTNKEGESKVLRECTLPLTGVRCVHAVLTDMAFFEVGESGLILRELAPGVTVEDIASCTEAAYSVAADVHTMTFG